MQIESRAELSYLVFAHWKEGADDNGRRDPPPLPHALSASLTPHASTHAHESLHPHMYHSQSHSQSHSAPPHTHCPSLSLRSVNGWVTLEVIIKALSDNELQVLDAYQKKNPSAIYEEERARLREEEPPTRESDDDGLSDG